MKKRGATRIVPERDSPSLLERLGVQSIESFWHGEVSTIRAIQASVLAIAVGYIAASAKPMEVPHNAIAEYARQPASLMLAAHDSPGLHLRTMSMLIEADASAAYVDAKDIQLNSQFSSKLQTELEKALHLADRTGHWDNALASRVNRLINSEYPLDRQVGNAVMRFISDHQMTAFSDIPNPAYYINTRAADIESSRQTFMLVDAARDAVVRSSMQLNERTLISILDLAGHNGKHMLALHEAQSMVSSSETDPAVRMVQHIRDYQNLRVTLQYMSDLYIGKPEVNQATQDAAARMHTQFGTVFEPRTFPQGREAAEQDRQALSQLAYEPRTAVVGSRMELRYSDGIAGRGVVSEDLGLKDEYAATLPEFRLAPENQMLRSAALDWEPEEPADFRVSM